MPNTYEASLARKARSEKHLRAAGVPINENLPRIEDEAETRLRSADDVAKRSVVLYSISAVGFGASSGRAAQWLQKEGLWDTASPAEQTFLSKPNPPQNEIANASWRVEALWTMLWSLGKVESLAFPSETCSLDLVQELMPSPDTSCDEFLLNAQTRSLSEILDETDMIYRIHWAVVESRLNGEEPPSSLNPSVVYERHYALNWLTYYAEDWDDVTTDT